MSVRTPHAVGGAGLGAGLTIGLALREGGRRSTADVQRGIDEHAAARQRLQRARYRAEVVLMAVDARDRANAALSRWLARQALAARND